MIKVVFLDTGSGIALIRDAVGQLDQLELPNVWPDVRTHLARADELQEAADAIDTRRRGASRAELIGQLAAGDLEPTRLPKELDAQRAEASSADIVSIYSAAARQAEAHAWAAAQQHGDRLVTDDLAPVVQAALGAPSDAACLRWLAVHDLADTLRAAGVLPTLHNGRSGSFDPREHRFSEPERLAELDGLEGADYLATASSIGAGIYSNEEVCGRNRTNRRRASWAA